MGLFLLIVVPIILKIIIDAIEIFIADVMAKSYNPYIEYRKYMDNAKNNKSKKD